MEKCPECGSTIRVVRDPIEHGGVVDICSNNWHWVGGFDKTELARRENMTAYERMAATYGYAPKMAKPDVTTDPAFKAFMSEVNAAFKLTKAELENKYGYLR